MHETSSTPDSDQLDQIADDLDTVQQALDSLDANDFDQAEDLAESLTDSSSEEE